MKQEPSARLLEQPDADHHRHQRQRGAGATGAHNIPAGAREGAAASEARWLLNTLHRLSPRGLIQQLSSLVFTQRRWKFMPTHNMGVCRSIMCHRQNLEAPKMQVSRWMDRYTVVHPDVD